MTTTRRKILDVVAPLALAGLVVGGLVGLDAAVPDRSLALVASDVVESEIESDTVTEPTPTPAPEPTVVAVEPAPAPEPTVEAVEAVVAVPVAPAPAPVAAPAPAPVVAPAPAPAPLVSCPAGSTAQSQDASGDTSCLPNECMTGVVDPVSMPQCSAPFRP